MGKGILRNSRSQHWYGLVTSELDKMGISTWEIKAPTGKGHPKLVVEHGGRVFKTPVPCSEKGSGNHVYIVRRLRHEFPELREQARAR